MGQTGDLVLGEPDLIRPFPHLLFLAFVALGLACAQGSRGPVPPARFHSSASPDASTPVLPQPSRAPGIPVPPAPTPPRAAFAVHQPTSQIVWELSTGAGSQRGGVNRFQGTLDLVGEDPTRSSLQLELDLESLYSDAPAWTERLLAPGALDVGHHPKALFHSSSVVRAGDHFEVTGDLTLHGVTRRVTIPASVRVQPLRARAESEFSLDLGEFGLRGSTRPEDPALDQVVLRVVLEAIPAP